MRKTIVRKMIVKKYGSNFNSEKNASDAIIGRGGEGGKLDEGGKKPVNVETPREKFIINMASPLPKTTPTVAPAPGSSPPRKCLTISRLIHRLGFGPAQLAQQGSGGGLMVADGAEILIVNAITLCLPKEWGLTPIQRSLTVLFKSITLLVWMWDKKNS